MAAAAAEPPPLTPEILHGTAARAPGLAGLQWHPGGRRVTYLRRGRELSAFEVRSGRERPLLALEQAQPASFWDYRWSPDGRRLVVPSGADLYILEKGRAPVRITRGPEPEELPDFSPDGSRLAYVRSGDLYVYDLRRRAERRLTVRPSDAVSNGRVDGVYEEELAGRAPRAFAWAPDGGALAYLQIDNTPVPLRTLIDLLQPGAPAQRFPAAGDPNPVPRLGVVVFARDASPRDIVWPLRDAEYLLPQLTWSPDSRYVVFQAMTRAQNRLELRRLAVARASAGAPSAEETILTETSRAWVDATGPPLFLEAGRAFLWRSDRGGPRQLFRCSTDAGVCRALTGDWNVDTLVGADETRGVAYVTAGYPLARERQLYSVGLADGRLTRLTLEAGTHEVALAPDGRSFLDVFSTAAQRPLVRVVTLPGLLARTIDAGGPRPSPAVAADIEAEWVDVTAADGTMLHGRLARPKMGIDGGGPRPAVVLAYGGPRGQLVRDVWSRDWASDLERLLVAEGYVVWTLDNRGTSGRGHTFESAVRGELGRVELADQLAGVAYLKQRRDVDGTRLGVCGLSYGGYLALYAAVHAPDVFRAVVAGAPVTDWRCYDSIYSERYLGLLRENGEGYSRSALLGKAGAVRAPVLLFHGTRDGNVHLEHTTAFAEELRAAGRAPTVELHEGEGHTYRTPAARIARDKAILAHFERHLKRARTGEGD